MLFWSALLLLFHAVFIAANNCNTATKLDRKHGPFSDDSLTARWYTLGDDFEWVHEEVSYETCGTTSPIWAQDDLPETNQQTKAVTGCVVSSTSACAKTYSVNVTKCDDEYIYYLSPTAAGEAYCFKYHDDDDDKDCEDERNHRKKFHRCHRRHRYVVLVIGAVIILSVVASIVAIYMWRKRRAAALKRKAAYEEKTGPENGPVVVTTNEGLPPKKY